MQDLKVGDVVFVGEEEGRAGSAGLFFFVNGKRRNPPKPRTVVRRTGAEVPADEGEWKFTGSTVWENPHIGWCGRVIGGEQFVITRIP
jgi:hypothetical protein